MTRDNSVPLKLMRFSANLAAGLGSLEHFGDQYEELMKGSPAIIIAGENSYKIAGAAVEDQLSRRSIDQQALVGHIEPTTDSINTLIEKIRKTGLRRPVLISVGGGSTIDIGKFVAHKLDLDLIAVPTLLSSDAIASGYSIIWDHGKNSAIRTKTPSLIFGDYHILQNEPKRFVSAGVGDMLSKISALYDWRMSFWLGEETYNDFVRNLASSTVKMLRRRIPDVFNMNYIGIETLFLAEVTDGYLMELSGTTRVAAGSEHLFTFALETLDTSGIHGEYCALGTIMMSYLQSRQKFRVKDDLIRAGAPTSASDLGIKPEKIVKALTMAHKMRPWYTILGTNGLSEGMAERLARYTHVI